MYNIYNMCRMFGYDLCSMYLLNILLPLCTDYTICTECIVSTGEIPEGSLVSRRDRHMFAHFSDWDGVRKKICWRATPLDRLELTTWYISRQTSRT